MKVPKCHCSGWVGGERFSLGTELLSWIEWGCNRVSQMLRPLDSIAGKANELNLITQMPIAWFQEKMRISSSFFHFNMERKYKKEKKNRYGVY